MAQVLIPRQPQEQLQLLAETFVQGDDVPSATSLSSGAIGSVSQCWETLFHTQGVITQGWLQLSLSVSGGTIGLTAGKSGTSVTGSITSVLYR